MSLNLQRFALALRQHAGVYTLALGALSLTGGAAIALPDATPSAPPVPTQAPVASAPAARLASPPVIVSGPLSDIGTAPAARSPVVALAAPSDLWDRIRRGFAMNDLDNDLVRDREQWYATRPDYIQRMTERSNRYLFHIVEEIERRNMPMELALLPFIESAFNPQAVSSARAAGMWQFMPATGQSFDLKQNVFRDDRRDVLAPTQAALDNLQQPHNRFGDWHLALAAYNWGQGSVNRAITRNQKEGLPTGYTDLTMPMETRMYVPKLQAVKNIIARPEAFNTRLPLIGNHPYFDTVVIERDMDVAVIARLSDISEADFRALNPSIKQPVVMAAGTPTILLPWESAGVFQRNLQAYGGRLASWTAWVVPSTMTVAQAAQKAGLSESELRRLNNIPPRMKLRAGSSLLVPRAGQHNRDVAEQVADNAHLSLQPEIILKRVSVRAHKGENLSKLANRYGVSPVSAAGWNKLAVNARLKSGQRITLMLPRAPALASGTASKRSVAKRSGQTRAQASVRSKAKGNSKAVAKTRASAKTTASAQPRTKVSAKRPVTKVAASNGK